MAQLEAEIARLRSNVATLGRIERSLIRLVGRLPGESGVAAIRVAVADLAAPREALDQAVVELEIEDGLLASSVARCSSPRRSASG